MQADVRSTVRPLGRITKCEIFAFAIILMKPDVRLVHTAGHFL